MTEIHWPALSLFPLIICLTILFLYLWPYRGLRDINQIFHTGYRSPALRVIILIIITLAIAVFLSVQFIRISFFVNLANTIQISNTIHTIIQFCGLAVFFCGITCELIVFTHLFIYLTLIYKGSRYQLPTIGGRISESPGVAVLIPACDEPAEALERSLGSVGRSAYPNLKILLVENSRDFEIKKSAHRLARKYGIKVVDIQNRGSKAAALNDVRCFLDQNIKYLMVMDADQSLQADIITELVPILEKNPGLAFVQTAQAYEINGKSLIEYAAAQQQMMLYDCVMEGKSVNDRAPCFGTNFIMRTVALDSVGGWDETNVTEDFTTSCWFHMEGWKSKYIRKIYALGLPPPSLESYWGQQKRWATGNSSLALRLIGGLLKHRKWPFSITMDYLWSSSFYMNMFFVSALTLLPTSLLIAGIFIWQDFSWFRYSLSPPIWVFASFYSFYVFVVFFPMLNMHIRGYPLRNMLLVQCLVTITNPVYLRGVTASLFSRKPVVFETSLRFRSAKNKKRGSFWLTPQIAGAVIFTTTGSVFTALAVSNPTNPILWILSFWSFIHSLSLAHFFLFYLQK